VSSWSRFLSARTLDLQKRVVGKLTRGGPRRYLPSGTSTASSQPQLEPNRVSECATCATRLPRNFAWTPLLLTPTLCNLRVCNIPKSPPGDASCCCARLIFALLFTFHFGAVRLSPGSCDRLRVDVAITSLPSGPRSRPLQPS